MSLDMAWTCYGNCFYMTQPHDIALISSPVHSWGSLRSYLSLPVNTLIVFSLFFWGNLCQGHNVEQCWWWHSWPRISQLRFSILTCCGNVPSPADTVQSPSIPAFSTGNCQGNIWSEIFKLLSCKTSLGLSFFLKKKDYCSVPLSFAKEQGQW